MLDYENSYLVPLLFFQKNLHKIVDIFCINKNRKGLEEIKIDENKQLMKRFNLVLNSKKINVFGVIVMNAQFTNFKNTFEGVLNLLRFHKKKHFIFTMNKLNEPKIKNFPEIEAFVIVSCPKSSIFDYKEFYKVIFFKKDNNFTL